MVRRAAPGGPRPPRTRSNRARTMTPPPGRRRIHHQAGCALATTGTPRTAAEAASAHEWRSAESTTSLARSSHEQQRTHTDGDGDEYRRLAERVEAAKVDEDDVDDVAAVGQPRRRVGEVGGQP